MEINIPPNEQQQLIELAALNGYGSPEEYASNLLVNAVQLEAFAELTPQELAESVESVERGISDVEAGRSRPAQEAMDDIASKFGFSIRR